MKSSEYWEKRIANSTWQTYNNLEEKNRVLLEMYQDASRAISDELYRLAEKMQTATPTRSDMHKHNRLTNLQKNMEDIIRELGENVESFGKDNMKEGFKETYSNVMTNLGITEFDMVPEKVMEEMLRKPWMGRNFSTSLWKNTQVLASNLNEILVNGITQGKTVTEMAIQLNNRMNEGFNVSHRLVRTETMHYLNESSKKAYRDGGCEEVQLWAAVDERTCPTCGIKHGNVYRIKDCPTLPLHANCRCTILPVVDDKDAKKDHDTAKEDIKKEWDRRSIPEEKIKDKIKRNYDSDKKQYKKYKDILGKEGPRSFADFQELKYNDINGWEELKSKYKANTSPKIKRDGATRADEFSKYWGEASLKETVNKFVPNTIASDVNQKGKIIYSSKDTKLQVVYDTKGNYFRIEDASRTDKKRYLDIEGNDITNIIENGKKRGTTKSEYQSRTHFKNNDKED